MKSLFYSPKVLGSGKIQVSSDTDRMEFEIYMPKKKPKGKELTSVAKQENKRISGIRIKVEPCYRQLSKNDSDAINSVSKIW